MNKSNSLLSISWKLKLTIVIAITLLGLIIVSGSAFIGLSNLNESFDKKTTALKYEQDELQLTKKLLELEFLSNKLTKNDVESFTAKIKNLNAYIESMKLKAELLNNKILKDYIEQFEILVNQYLTLRAEWLSERTVLGFNATEGQSAELFTNFYNLEKVSFSMIEKFIVEIRKNQNQFIQGYNDQTISKMEAAISSFEATVIDLDWGDSDVGINLRAYRATFDAMTPILKKEKDILLSLSSIFEKIEISGEEQNQFLVNTVIANAEKESEAMKNSAISFIAISSAVVGVIILFSLAAISKQLHSQIKSMQDFLNHVAEGNFSQRLTLNNNTKDEFTQLRSTSNHMVEDISTVISRVVDGSKSLHSLKKELEHAVNELAETSKEVEIKTQASTTATQQISTAINDVAKRSSGVYENTQATALATKKGTEVVNDCVRSMASISGLIEKSHQEVKNLAQSSTQMLGIIDIINGLADQTNLLALNAAIESARAGEAGRGFSVVADEVRALAQKTVGATSSIGDIIKDLNDQSKNMDQIMEEGIKLASSGQQNANNAMDSLTSINSHINNVQAEMDQVVVAMEEASYNTNDIRSQVEDIYAQSEKNKNTRLKLEGHIDSLSSQADLLKTSTSRFKIGNS